ncbi:MAG TPA: chitobiase/beta-hexosaminidase C-terminal domain-containing protein, partial [Verrucomicrobiae bacterium]
AIRYALGAAARTGRLIVNGVTNALTFNPTATWTNWTMLTQAINLNAGLANDIRFESSGSGLVSVDEITVTPANHAVVADLVITCATPEAVIYYTLDGTLPTAASLLYSGPLHLTDAGVLRARAFLTGCQPSVAALMNLAPAPTVGVPTLTRSVETNLPWAPRMNLSFTPGTGAVCQAYEEFTPPDLSVANVSGDGVWNNGVIRWGPYLGTSGQTFSYTARGAAGSYAVGWRWSHDGTGTELGATNLLVAGTTNTVEIPVAPSRLPAPVLLPGFANGLPVVVSITNAVPGAQIRYTTDGSTPQTGSPLYTGPINLAARTTLRVRAFLAGWLPSDAVVGYYGALPNDADTAVTVTRTIPVNTNAVPQVVLNTTPQGNVGSYTVTEFVPPGLLPTNLTQNAVWNAAERTVKWGPFANQAMTLNYQLVGTAGDFRCDGQESVDGYSSTITGQSNVVVTGTTDIAPPVPPVKLPTPTLSPARSNALPVMVAASCAVGTAQLRYTLDGTPPTASSPLYTAPLSFTAETTLRVRAFLAGWQPSDAVVGYYQPRASLTDLVINRVVTNSPSYAPRINLTATPSDNVSAYTVVEIVPYGITPFAVSPAATWNAADRTLKWGPFANEPRNLSYQVSGVSGTNVLDGAGTMDGFVVAVRGDTNVVVDLSLMPDPAAPAITLQPLSQPVAAGFDLVLYVEAVGAPAPSYQWRKDGVALGGASSQVLVRTNFQAADVGNYDVVVTNTAGAATSQVAVVSIMAAPAFTQHPQSQTLRAGQTATFTALATGVPLPTYQWRFNGVPMAGKTSPTLSLPNVTTEQAGSYDVLAANQVATVPSEPASLVVRTDGLSIGNTVRLSSGQVELQIEAVAGRRYRLEYKEDLADPVWHELPAVTGINGILVLSDTVGSAPQRFYRVREE